MKEQTELPESLRNEMRRAVQTRWAKTTAEQRSEFARMLWRRRVQKHEQAVPRRTSSQAKTKRFRLRYEGKYSGREEVTLWATGQDDPRLLGYLKRGFRVVDSG